MRKLLNTLYVTNEEAYLSLDGLNVVCSVGGETKLRLPFDNLENITRFGYLGCSPALMGACAERQIPINFISPQGKFLARVVSPTRGNVFLRVAQMDKFRDPAIALNLAKNTLAAKLANCVFLIKRSVHDNSNLKSDAQVANALDFLPRAIKAIYDAKDAVQLLGIEGSAAGAYFCAFGSLLTTRAPFKFEYRNRRPPLDPINAALSFAYTLLTSEFTAALETVGLDPQIGYFHALRSGRASLACDLVEEARHIAERFVLTQFNLGVLSERDFETQISGATYLAGDGRKKFLSAWQAKKRSDFAHPYLAQKIPLGLLPYVQANLLAKFVRGELDEYPALVRR